MPKQLNVRSDEAYYLAHALAENEKKSTQDVVVQALREYAKRRDANDGKLSAEQLAQLNSLKDLGRKFRSKWKPGESADHRDMYDEYGLPI